VEEAFNPQNSLDGVSGLPTIPVQPLSYGDAAHLFANLSGLPVPSSDWIGGFNQTTFASLSFFFLHSSTYGL